MNPPLPKAVRKYLEDHAEPEAREAATDPLSSDSFGHVLCIPAHGESESLFETLASIPPGPHGDNLILLIVNETPSTPEGVRETNAQTLKRLRREFGSDGPVIASGQPLSHPTGTLWLVDRSVAAMPLPDGQGVGLARKVVSDIALAVWSKGQLASPWIHCTDADAVLPRDYFERAAAVARHGANTPAALLYDFTHARMTDPAVDRAALRYEIFLRYYVLGLHAAGSPWAHQSLGSTLAVHALAYAQVRGFPKRLAAEDFHLLAKLGKLGPLRQLRGEPITLSGRPSDRVPFGTGVGVTRELERMRTQQPYPAYDPRVFSGLKAWLGCLAELTPPHGAPADGPSEGSLRQSLGRHALHCGFPDPALLWSTLSDQGDVSRALRASGQGPRALNEGFDALRTLRFVHRLRDGGLPSIPLLTALDEAPFIDPITTDDLASVRGALQTLEARRQPGLHTAPVGNARAK